MNNTLVVTVKTEFIKITSRAKNKVLFFIIAAASLGISLFSMGGFSLNISGIKLNFNNGAFFVLSILNSVILPLLSFMLCADIISHEFADQTIKAGLLRPVGKSVLFLSKWAAVVLFGACCLGVSFIFGGLTSVILGRVDIFSVLTAFFISILPLCASASMSAFLSTAVSNPSMAMFLSIGLYILLQCAGFISSSLGVIFYTAHVNWYKMFLGSTIPGMNIINITFMIIAYTVLFLTFGKIIFSAKKV